MNPLGRRADLGHALRIRDVVAGGHRDRCITATLPRSPGADRATSVDARADARVRQMTGAGPGAVDGVASAAADVGVGQADEVSATCRGDPQQHDRQRRVSRCAPAHLRLTLPDADRLRPLPRTEPVASALGLDHGERRSRLASVSFSDPPTRLPTSSRRPAGRRR